MGRKREATLFARNLTYWAFAAKHEVSEIRGVFLAADSYWKRLCTVTVAHVNKYKRDGYPVDVKPQDDDDR